MKDSKRADQIGLPPRMFMYTPDQLATMLEVSERHLMDKLVYFEGRSPGVIPKDKFHAINIAPEGDPPQWRISERSVIRYLRFKGIKFYERKL